MSSFPSPLHEAPVTDAPGLLAPVPRRSFLRYSGAGLALGGLYLAGCSKDDTTGPSSGGLIDVGTGDTGILNYTYALEQLEAAFYTQVLAGAYYAGASAAEKAVFSDLQAHEVIHRDFFKAAIATGRITDALMPDFSGIDFGVRTTAAGAAKLGVLQAAMAFEDLGVAAYNGAGRFITDATYLTLAGKIVSVEARHAAVIRELMAVNTFVFSDVVDTTTTGLEKSKRPQVVLATANNFLMAGSKLSATNYPS